MQAMIFAAGLGTRLKPLTDTKPKALVEVGGQPLLWHVIRRLKEAGFGRVVINVHHFASQIVDYVRAHDAFGMDIRISDEQGFLLETGGGIRHAAPLFDAAAPVLIHNVDILSNVNLAQVYASIGQDDAALLVSERTTKRYLLFDDEDALCGWTNVESGALKGPVADGGMDAARLQRLAFSGIHVFSPRLFPLMQPFPEKFGIIDFYLQACRTRSIRAVKSEGLQLLDVGKADSLAKAEQMLAMLQGTAR